MKKPNRFLCMLLALVLGLSVCCTGMAEDASVYTKYVEDYFTELLKFIPGGDNIDWEGFASAYNERIGSGTEIILEDCLPAEAWQYFSTLMLMREDGTFMEEEDLPGNVKITVEGDTIATVHQLWEQADEETAKLAIGAIRAEFERDLSLGYLKVYLDQFCEAGVNKDNLRMTLQFLNADGTVLEEGAYTYADLEAALVKSLQAYFANLFSLVLDPEEIDWAAFTKNYEEKVAGGGKLTLEDCFPEQAWHFYSILMRMDNNTYEIVPEEELPYTVSVSVEGNRFRAVHQLKEKMDTDEAYDLIARIRAYFEVPAALQGLKNLFDWFAGIDVSMDELTMAVQYLDADGAILYDKEYTYAELAAALDPAAVEPAAK